ncbi:hypothetical protein J2S43_005441 [Catenuloplanes nepalensis]|uniref:HEAT repeat domain-containing protein n=1 Tax=Catenuloplanes nepalensis TaxID=587533 RepID=A0ABT9MZP6_9ACTN|nr:hypothetical protein [Catenuloplanes nepalensis]MDP9796929.1 hypothetical protein [Catenuloplanes nepalensis]
MLDGLDDVPWHRLGHAYGTASDVPGQLRDLLSGDVATRGVALWQLGGNIVHQGSRFQASAAAVPFLLEILAGPSPLTTTERVRLIELLGELAIGDPSFYPSPAFPLDEIRADAAAGSGLMAAFEAGPYDGDDFMEYLSALDEPDQERLGAVLLLRVYEAVRAGKPLLERLRAEEGDGAAALREAATETLHWL